MRWGPVKTGNGVKWKWQHPKVKEQKPINKYMVSRVDIGRNAGVPAKKIPSDAKMIGNIKNLEIFREDRGAGEVMIYIARPDGQVIGNLEINRVPGNGPWQVEMVSIDSRYQGFNLVPMLYRMLMLNLPGFVLEAGRVQSTGGRSIWNTLAKFPDIVVYTMKNGEAVELANDPLSGEVSGEEDDINAYSDYEDNTRIFATKR